MASRCNEVQQNVDTVVAESGVTLNTRFLCKNVIVLALEIANDLSEAGLVVDLVTETRGIDNGQRDACALLIKF
jgi:hypothetical protein